MSKILSIDKFVNSLDENNSLKNIIKKDPKRERSVHTKFRLKKSTFEDLNWLSNYSNRTEKSILDSIAEDLSFLANIAEALGSENSIDVTKTIRKSKVISSGSLVNLRAISAKYKITRDQLIETSIMLLKHLLQENIKKTKDVHKSALAIVKELWGKIEGYEAKLKKLLGEDDPIVYRMGFIAVVAMNLSGAIESELQDGVPIDPDDMSQSV